MQGEAEQYADYAKQLETELMNERGRTAQLTQGQPSMFTAMQDENLIRWQLDLKEELDRIYHLLRGDIVTEDEDGNVFYKEPATDNLKPLNEFGVQLIMNILSFYLNRNTILSNYDDETINWKVHDFGIEVSDLIFTRYEEMGMDTSEKIKMYPLIVKELVDTVHSAYLRAWKGGERESLRTARTVTQHDPISQQFGHQGMQPKKFSVFRPSTWK